MTRLSIKSEVSWALVIYTCNPSYLEAEMGRIVVQDQPEQIVHETPVSRINTA
jgi:hypothetical protein